MKHIQHRPLHPAIGAEVLNVDMSTPLEADVVQELVKLWEDRSVLLFRNQELTPEDQLRLTGYFGEVREAFFKDLPERKINQTHPQIVFISNVRVDGKPIGSVGDGELWFHSDHCYLPKSGRASILYAIEVPSQGGDTRFASGYAAYEALSPEIKSKLNGVSADFVHDIRVNAQARLHQPGDDAPRAVHPAVVLHPGTKRPSLFVNRLMTTRLIGMDPAESDALLQYLFDYQEQPQFTYDHKWQPGDLLIWDNRSCLHARTEFDPTERRLMRRTATAGEALSPA